MDKNRRTPTKRVETVVIAVLILIILAILLDLYGRYTYVNTSNATVVRIDRLTGESCTMPCGSDGRDGVVVAEPDPSPSSNAKACHNANVVRVGSRITIPKRRRPYPYLDGGFDSASAVVRNWKSRQIPYATELTDGHIYSFSSLSYVIVSGWSTGQALQVCATWSKIERRPFYSVGEADSQEPATIAI